MINWDVKEQDKEIIDAFVEHNIHPVIAKLLYNRGFRAYSDVVNFFDIDINKLYSPFLLPDINEACERIKSAILKKEKITVYGDYDVDGITSVSMLYKYLTDLGVDADYYIPDRKDEGYGLNIKAIESIKNKKTSLIITVDTGTTAIEEVEYAKTIGMDIIITDHHECKETLPDCPVINPKRSDSKYPFKELAGVGVVFKLISALSEKTEQKDVFEKYGGFVAIGTIADIMPLVDENRIIVSEGLKLLENPPEGIKALLSASGISDEKTTSATIAYKIAPRLNAAGRIGDPKNSVEVLLSNNPAKASVLAQGLCEENTIRQESELKILEDVKKRIASQVESLDNIIIEASENWHSGIIGIVASRISDTYSRPCILFCIDGENAKGSARSVKGVNIFEILRANASLLSKFGGHEMAAGLTLNYDDFDMFAKTLREYSNKNIPLSLLSPSVEAECELPYDCMNVEFLDKLKTLEPFGEGNTSPLFVINSLTIAGIFGVSQNKHTRISFESPTGNGQQSSIYFGHSLFELSCFEGDEVNIVCQINENIFRNKRSLSIIIKNIQLDKKTEVWHQNYIDKYRAYAKSLDISTLSDDMKITRDDVALVYKHIKRQIEMGAENISPLGICRRLSMTKNTEMNYCRLRFCLNVLKELEIIDFSVVSAIAVSENKLFKITMNDKKKTNLSKSTIFSRVCL